MGIEIIGMVATAEASEVKGSRDAFGAVDAAYLAEFEEVTR